MNDTWISRSSAALWLPAALCVALTAAIAYWVLRTGHPHEDAYILYIYAEQLASGNGITYFEGGPPIEGATDFLWMLALAALHRVGIDIAIAAGLLNALGLGALTALGSWLTRDPQRPRRSLLIGLGFATLVVLSPMAMASYGGFSTGLYCAFTALCCALLYRQRLATLPLIPVLGLLLGLLRPDGVVIGVASTCVAATLVVNSPARGRFMAACVLSALLGIGYFAWRTHYFGEWLPLPLYVKGLTSAWLPGIPALVNWGFRALPLAAIALLGLWLAPHNRRGALFAAVGPAALLLFLLFGENTQNVSYRFQAPATALLALGAAIAMPRIASASIPAKLATLAAVVVIAWQGAMNLRATVAELQRTAYINYLPALLAPQMSDDTVIALTEAGRFAYWTPGKTYDLVGLNTAKTAKDGPTVAYLQQLHPDLFFVHTAGTIDPTGCGSTNYCPVTAQELLSRRTALFVDDSPSRVIQAPVAAVQYLAAQTDYDLLLVRYGHTDNVPTFYHLYAVRHGAALSSEALTDALDRSFAPHARRPYLPLKASTR